MLGCISPPSSGRHQPLPTPANPCHHPRLRQTYVFDILASEISERSGGQYKGPNLVVDARHWRNEAALANCVFGSGQKSPSLQAEVRRSGQALAAMAYLCAGQVRRAAARCMAQRRDRVSLAT